LQTYAKTKLHIFFSRPNPQGFKVSKTAGIQASKIDLKSEVTQPSQKIYFQWIMSSRFATVLGKALDFDQFPV